MDYSHLKIAEYTHWQVYLHQSQYYLGRCYIWSKREGLVDLMDMSWLEMGELFDIGRQLQRALTRLFHPDLFNQLSLGNTTTHLHLHVVPRYKEPREFVGITFADGNWGKNYVPYDRDFRVFPEVLQKLKLAISRELLER